MIYASEDSKKIDIEDPKKWIQANIFQNKETNVNSMRNKYLNKLGFKKTPEKISNEEILENSKISDKNEENLIKENDLKLEKEYFAKNNEFLIKFFNKTDNDIRNNYLQKLMSNKILKKEPSKKHQSSKK